jgi:hypothetical protein
VKHSYKLAAIAVVIAAGLAWAQDPAAMKKEHEVAQIDSLVAPVAR